MGILTNKIFIGIAAILIALLVAVVFLPKATVTVLVDMRTLENDATVIADPSIAALDEANKKIPGKIVDSSQTGSARAQATGKKQIGDPAKGAVVIYNKTAAAKTFSQGTVLVGDNNLTFTLDSSVNVASQSAVDGGISFGICRSF